MKPAGAKVAMAALLVLGLGLAIHGGWVRVKASLAQTLLERAFALDLATGLPHKPWPWADTTVVARLDVPRLHLSRIVLSGASGQALAFGPAQLGGAGEVGALDTAVFAAHRDTHFGFLGELVVGDLIRVVRLDGSSVGFRVTGRRIVAFDAYEIDRRPARPSLDLVTCWPLTSVRPGPLRLVVSTAAVASTDLAKAFRDPL